MRKIFFITFICSVLTGVAQKKAIIILAHPSLQQSQTNKKLLQAINNDKNIVIHDLYALYPDEKIDIAKEQQLIQQFDVIVFQFPLYWFSAPPLLHKWQDEVITSKFALSKNNPLQNKSLAIVTTVGGTKEDFTKQGSMQSTIDEILSPFKAFAALCHIQYQKPFVVYGVPNPAILSITMTEEQKANREKYLNEQAELYKKYLLGLLH